MKVIETDLPGCVVIEPHVHGDARGYFYESFHAEKYRKAGLDLRFVQSNVSRSAHGVLRGLHYQFPNPQGKLVSVLEGEVYDVAVDIRAGSPTFGRWAAAVLSGATSAISGYRKASPMALPCFRILRPSATSARRFTNTRPTRASAGTTAISPSTGR